MFVRRRLVGIKMNVWRRRLVGNYECMVEDGCLVEDD